MCATAANDNDLPQALYFEKPFVGAQWVFVGTGHGWLGNVVHQLLG